MIKYLIILFLLVASPCWADFPTTSVLDDFNRSDATPPPGTNWTYIFPNGADGGLVIDTNQLAPTLTSDDNNSYWNVSTFGADSEGFATISNKGAFTDTFRVGVRIADIVTDTKYDGYVVQFSNVDGNDTIRLRRIDDASGTTIATYTAGTDFTDISNGDKIGITAVGSTITAWYAPVSDGVWVELGHVTDATYSAAGYLFVNINTSSGGTTLRADDFGGGTVVTAAPPSTSRRIFIIDE